MADYATKTWVNEQGFATGTIPTNVSQLTNDSGFLTQQSLNGYVNNVNVTEVTNGNGIASIAKNGKDINVTQGAFLTAIRLNLVITDMLRIRYTIIFAILQVQDMHL